MFKFKFKSLPTTLAPSKNPFKVANISLNDHRADNAQGGKDATSLEPVAPMIKVPKYLRQKKRMHTRIRIVASCANDRPMTKRFQRFRVLGRTLHTRTRGKERCSIVRGCCKGEKPKAPPPDLVMAGHYVTLRTSKDANELWKHIKRSFSLTPRHTLPLQPLRQTHMLTSFRRLLSPPIPPPLLPPRLMLSPLRSFAVSHASSLARIRGHVRTFCACCPCSQHSPPEATTCSDGHGTR